MKAVILAGGKGTRLRPITCELPKPMLPVMNLPLLEHILLLLKKQGIFDVGITLMYLPQKIKNYFDNGAKWGMRLTYFTEAVPLGTAGSIVSAASFLRDTFVVISGDCMTDLNLSKAIEFHRQKKAIATLVLTRVPSPFSFGIVTTDSSGYITGFLEKPTRGEVFSDMVNTGVYVLEPEVFDYIEPGKYFDFSRDLFPRLLAEGLPLSGYTTHQYWSDVGTLESYVNTHLDILAGKLKTLFAQKPSRSNLFIGPSTIIEPTAEINSPCVIGSNCYIGHGVVIGRFAVIGDNCLIEDQSSIVRGILMNHCTVGHHCKIRGSILGNKVNLMRYVSCYENAMIGDECVIHDHSIIKPNTRIWPGKTINPFSVVDRNITLNIHPS